jgi:hypothetical protein
MTRRTRHLTNNSRTQTVPDSLRRAVLFEVGKFLIGLYIGKQGLESAYGGRSVDHRGADLGLLLRPARADGC